MRYRLRLPGGRILSGHLERLDVVAVRTSSERCAPFVRLRGIKRPWAALPSCQFRALGRTQFNFGQFMTRDDEEMQKIDREHALRAHGRHREEFQNSNKAAIEAGNIAIRSLLLINGGASVALLAFVGAVESGNSEINSAVLVEPIWRFALGVGLAVLTAILAYLVNLLDAEMAGSNREVWEYPYIQETPRAKKLDVFRELFFYAALLSASLYFLGVWSITTALSNLGI